MKSAFFSLLLFLVLTVACEYKAYEPTITPYDVSTVADSTTETGLVLYKIIPGTGALIKNGARVSIQYNVYFEDLTLISSTRLLGSGFTFTAGSGEVIAGIEEAMLYLRSDARARLIVPPALAYGDRSYGKNPVIPPGSVLVFDIDVQSAANNAKTKEELTLLSEYAALEEIADKGNLHHFYYLPADEGQGDVALPGDSAVVEYTGYYLFADTPFVTSSQQLALDYEIFADTIDYTPYCFRLAEDKRVMNAWHQAIARMRQGAKVRIIFPSYLANNKQFGTLDANTSLIFDLELTHLIHK